MRRRDFLAIAGSAVAPAVLPCVALAQQATKIPRIEVLSLATLPPDRMQALTQALVDAGYVDGKTAIIEILIAANETDTDVLVDHALASNPDLIITMASPAPAALKARGTKVPVIFAFIADPVAEGFAETYARPGGNYTGAMQGNGDLVPKQLQVLREILPMLRRLAVFVDPADTASAAVITQRVLASAHDVGIDTVWFDINVGENYEATIDRAVRGGAQGIFMESLALLNADTPKISPIAISRGMPLFGSAPAARLGALVSYAANINATIRSSVPYVDEVLKRSKKPGELPIIGPTPFDFVVNMPTALALGITIPQSILSQATEVIA